METVGRLHRFGGYTNIAIVLLKFFDLLRWSGDDGLTGSVQRSNIASRTTIHDPSSRRRFISKYGQHATRLRQLPRQLRPASHHAQTVFQRKNTGHTGRSIFTQAVTQD